MERSLDDEVNNLLEKNNRNNKKNCGEDVQGKSKGRIMGDIET